MGQSCPDAEQLHAFAMRLVDAGRFDAMAQHVEGCADCQEQLEQLDGSSDQLVQHPERQVMAAHAA